MGSFATPATLAFTGMLYLTGWEERHKLLRDFGLTNSAFEETIQVTLARGYRPLLLGMFVVLLSVSALWLANKFFSSNLKPAPSTVRLAFGYVVFWSSFFILTCAYLAGNLSGTLRAEHLAQTLENGCRGPNDHCYVYHLGRAHYLGVVVTQDTKRTALLTRSGLVLVETSAIDKIVPLRPVSRWAGKDLSSWPLLTLVRE